ncbi:hypothetical protein AGR7A_pAt20133 [Agrobacterium deltaense NCPPB 1641]|uniref:Uncharacterized protein n=1 Tax=Agrobacterium deltaense NCPPB 1641 TaxID=1183425 RepID=A0A1S7U8K5_9HYPH|nr:hypothetical protein AGR7A_pAt20133 [Agrobacterium deltaense NCPPB 1641]
MDLLLELQPALEIAILLEHVAVDGVEMLFNVNDLGAGYDNVTSQFAISAKDQTVLLFRRLLGNRVRDPCELWESKVFSNSYRSSIFANGWKIKRYCYRDTNPTSRQHIQMPVLPF